MSYTTGTANDAGALRSAIFVAALAAGWTLTGEILSKGTQAMRIEISTVGAAVGLQFTAGKSQAAGTLVGPCPRHVSIGDRTNLAFSWPVTYHLFAFAAPDEFYAVINYNVDQYQYAAWGTSTQALPGTGMWFGATLGDRASSPITTFYLSANGQMGSDTYNSPALFWRLLDQSSGGWAETYMHHGLDGDVWSTGDAATPAPAAAQSANPLLALLPNAWNGEVVLLPIQALAIRPSNMSSLVATPANARYVRIDNQAPGDVVTLGADQWMLFPWLRKDSASRNGQVAQTTGMHSGTLGWALRYEGV